MTTRRTIAVAGAIALLCATFVAAAMTGAFSIAPERLAGIVCGREHDAYARAFIDLRLPRLCIAMLVGAALATAGALLQGLLRNPLVDPYLTGSSAGAACAVAIAIVTGILPMLLPVVAFAAALATAAGTMSLARVGRGLSTERLILAGVSLSAFFAAIVTLILTLVPATNDQLSILAWLGGTLAGRGWPEFRWAFWYAASGMVAALFLAPTLNALRLGEARAQALGVAAWRAQWSIVATASLLTAAAVSVSGMVGFVGLIMPHVARRCVGGDARWMLPLAALLGAASVLAADALARGLAAPLELPLGVLLALIGVPVFLLLLVRRRRAA